jgi:uncharacterized protein (TIGR00255 family)
MIKSMTAFARSEGQYEWGSLVWEIRSLNHRYLEVNVRLPEELRALESAIREHVGKKLNRGKVECGLRFKRNPGTLSEMILNREQAQRLIQMHNETNGLLGDSTPLRALDLMRWPGVVEEGEADMAPVKEAAVELLDTALEQLVETRLREGSSLKEIIISRCDSMADIVQLVVGKLPEIRENLKNRLKNRLQEIDVEVDESRLEQEMVIQLQKMDVDEEIERLRTHIQEVRDVLERNEPVGRRLDFLMQELNREANTLGSKSVAMDTTGASVDLKVLIEQMREQIQNIE